MPLLGAEQAIRHNVKQIWTQRISTYMRHQTSRGYVKKFIENEGEKTPLNPHYRVFIFNDIYVFRYSTGLQQNNSQHSTLIDLALVISMGMCFLFLIK